MQNINSKNMTFIEWFNMGSFQRFYSSVTEGPSKMPRMIQKSIRQCRDCYRVGQLGGMKN